MYDQDSALKKKYGKFLKQFTRKFNQANYTTKGIVICIRYIIKSQDRWVLQAILNILKRKQTYFATSILR